MNVNENKGMLAKAESQEKKNLKQQNRVAVNGTDFNWKQFSLVDIDNFTISYFIICQLIADIFSAIRVVVNYPALLDFPQEHSHTLCLICLRYPYLRNVACICNTFQKYLSIMKSQIANDKFQPEAKLQ